MLHYWEVDPTIKSARMRHTMSWDMFAILMYKIIVKNLFKNCPLIQFTLLRQIYSRKRRSKK